MRDGNGCGWFAKQKGPGRGSQHFSREPGLPRPIPVQELSNLEKRVLLALGAIGDQATPEQIQEQGAFSELVQVMNASSWLQAKGLVRHEETMRHYISLGKEGQLALARGLPERRVVEIAAAHGGPIALSDLQKNPALEPGEVNIATGWLKRKNLANLSKVEGATVIALTDEGHTVAQGKRTPDEAVLDTLKTGEKGEPDVEKDGLAMLLQRQNMVRRREEITRLIHLTKKGRIQLDKGIEIKEQVNELTTELIGSGKWRNVDIRPYDVTAFAPTATGGKRHPMRQIIDKIRQAFLEMGFSEIEGPYTRNAFWNMDALFIPQDHPARAMQDTFYLNTPPPVELDAGHAAKVKAVQEHGGDTGSLGYRMPWSQSIAQQMLLRTHTTVDTIQYLSRHPEGPVKVFSVDRVFRNEAIDATHLPEFHQVEGIVMEEGANLRMLIGLLREFYKRMGFEEINVRPSYYPYTEPSIDIAVRWNDKWLELGGAGIFRQEVTKPWGVQHPVLAWGLGLERLAMLMLGLKDLRELYVSDVDWLRNAPLTK